MPPGWEAPRPLEPATPPKPKAVEDEAAPARKASKANRFWTTTGVFALLYALSVPLLNVEGATITAAFFLLPVYLVTLLVVMAATPRPKKVAKPRLKDRLDWQHRLMVGVVIFICAYVPFTIVSSSVIPYAAIVEYALFGFLLFLLLRLGGRSTGIASSLDALPPPTHRLHQQVVAPIDDRHYQETLWMNYDFVERGRGSKHIAKRLEAILEAQGVSEPKRREVLGDLESFEGPGIFRKARTLERDKDRRVQVLDRTFTNLARAMEQAG